jgi:hypothetical protein
MTGYLLVGLVFLSGIFAAVIGELVNEEMRGWLDHLPHVVLRLAAKRLGPAGKTTVYDDEWLPELTYILRGAEARPLSRLIIGIKFSVGLLISANRVARQLHRLPVGSTQIIEVALNQASEVIEVSLNQGSEAIRMALFKGIAEKTAAFISVPVGSPSADGTAPRAIFATLADGRELRMSHQDLAAVVQTFREFKEYRSYFKLYALQRLL